MLFFKPMFRQLKQGSMVPEMKAGLWMIMQSIQERNYLAGYDIFMRLAIGEPCHRRCTASSCQQQDGFAAAAAAAPRPRLSF